MIRHLKSVRKIAREISDAADGALDAYREGRVDEEPQLTDRILGAIEDRILIRPLVAYEEHSLVDLMSDPDRILSVTKRGIVKQPRGGIVWKARTLRTGRGVAAEEKRHGADLMGILDLALPDYHVTKGFLAHRRRKRNPASNFQNQIGNRCVRSARRCFFEHRLPLFGPIPSQEE